MREKTFGVKLENQVYRDRVGVYAVIFDDNGKVATVKTRNGYFLIGGGIEDGEEHKECLERECLEETGYDVEIKEFICKGDKFSYSDILNCYFHPIGYFYLVELKSKVQEPVETDHQFEWVSIDEVQDKMYLEHQAWAIEQGVNFS